MHADFCCSCCFYCCYRYTRRSFLCPCPCPYLSCCHHSQYPATHTTSNEHGGVPADCRRYHVCTYLVVVVANNSVIVANVSIYVVITLDSKQAKVRHKKISHRTIGQSNLHCYPRQGRYRRRLGQLLRWVLVTVLAKVMLLGRSVAVRTLAARLEILGMV